MIFRTLVSVGELTTYSNEGSWRIFDCRHDLAQPDAGEQLYRAAHIANAQFLHLDRDLSGPKTGDNGRHPLPDPAVLATTLGRCGVTNDTQVVAYDNHGSMFAARLWWLLRWLGHSKVAVLDGGLSAWQHAGHAVTQAIPSVQPTVFTWKLSEPTVDAEYVRAHLQQPDMLLLDARAPDRFRGENETLDPVGGHIPGAGNRFFKNNLTTEGHFKPAAQLRQEFDALLGDHPAHTLVNQCGSGVTACHNLLALEIAGLQGARLYPGSWSEWCSDPRRPIATR
ncbi:MAG: sulfurtransferase [Gammaproteobacteria bacterium]|nr:sulfurtransferase [Gammaproteobacteria bacterium]